MTSILRKIIVNRLSGYIHLYLFDYLRLKTTSLSKKKYGLQTV